MEDKYLYFSAYNHKFSLFLKVEFRKIDGIGVSAPPQENDYANSTLTGGLLAKWSGSMERLFPCLFASASNRR